MPRLCYGTLSGYYVASACKAGDRDMGVAGGGPGSSPQPALGPGLTPGQAGDAQQRTQAADSLFTILAKGAAWFSNAEHWKGIGLIVAAGVLGIVGLVMWSGHGGDTVRVATQTGMRMAM